MHCVDGSVGDIFGNSLKYSSVCVCVDQIGSIIGLMLFKLVE